MPMSNFMISRLAGLALVMAMPAGAVIFHETGDESHNTASPGDNSGWQYEGKFNAYLGVPIAPLHFITATHIGGIIGDTLDFHGDLYVTTGFQNIPGTDLRVWQVEAAKPFPTYAPVSNAADPTGALVTLIGRGTRRGADVTVSGQLKGWQWGAGDSVQRWGRNVISGTTTDEIFGEFLFCNFDLPGVDDECHLSIGDSGGGMFVLEEGLWKLAGIHYAVDGPFRFLATTVGFNAALFDRGGMEEFADGVWTAVTDKAADLPSAFYSSKIAASLEWLRENVGPEVDILAPEDFNAWRTLYFTPAQIADPAVVGALEDPDVDGISNLLEFALNLDPVVNGRFEMIPGSGLRGLPVASSTTLEFVRRTADVTSTAEFSPDLEDWVGSGTETVTAINPRWERVIATAPAPLAAGGKVFARLKVTLAD